MAKKEEPKLIRIKLLSEYIGKKTPDAKWNDKLAIGDEILVGSTIHLSRNGIKFEVIEEPEVKPKAK